MTAPANGCYDRDVLASWALGRLPRERFEQVAAHLETCADCQTAVASFDQVSDPLVRLLRSPTPVLNTLAPLKSQASTIDHRGVTDTATPAASPSPLPPEFPDLQMHESLGKGGMGQVYKAWHLRLKCFVAVKVLHGVGHSELARARFDREMQALARLDHPNIVRVRHAGEADGKPYLVMDFLEGNSLDRYVKERGPLPVAEACALIRQAALGLQHAHESGLIHRDVKPANLLRTSKGEVKVLDLGLVRGGADEGGDLLTDPGGFMGTPGFVAPEQVSDCHAAGVPADVFSLGCTLYFLLTGTPPFAGNTMAERLHALKNMSFTPLAVLRPDCPKEVLNMVASMLDKRPTARCASAGLVAERLRPFCPEAGAAAAGTPRPAKAPRRRGLAWAAVVVLGLVGLAVALGFALLPTDPQKVTVKTPQGTLVLNFPKGVPATTEVLVNGSRVTLKGIDDKNGEVTVEVGDHAIEVRDGKTVYRKDKVQIKRDEATVLEVTLDRSTAVAQGKPDDDGPVGEIANMTGFEALAVSVKFSPSLSHAITSEAYSKLRFWDLEKRKLAGSTGKGLLFIAVAADGRTVACLKGSQIDLVLTSNGALAGSFPTDIQGVGWTRDFSFSANGGSLLSAGFYDGLIRVWDVKSKKLSYSFKHGSSAFSACFLDNGKQILSGGNDNAVRLWDVEKDRQEKSYEGHDYALRLVRPLSDGKRFVSACQTGKVIVWDLKSGNKLQTLPLKNVGVSYEVLALAVAPKVNRLLAGHGDGTITVWDLDKGEQVGKLPGHKQGTVLAVDISPDGRYALSVGMDNILRYWRLPPVASAEGKRLPEPVEKSGK